MPRPSPFRNLFGEFRGRSLWHVLLAYLGISWAVLEALDLFSERYGLPAWLFTAALALLGVGLLTLVAAALLGTGAPPERHGDATGRDTKPPPAAVTTWTRAGVVLLSVIGLWAVAATGWLVVSRGEAEALLTRGEVLAELERFRTERILDSAFVIVDAYREELSGDSAFEALRGAVTRSADIHTEPAGARVSLQIPGTEEWFDVGITPVEGARLPMVLTALRLEAEGHEPLEMLTHRWWPLEPLRLAEVDGPNAGMVFVPGGEYRMEAPGLESLEPIPMDPSWLDRFEVTNAEYAEFVDAGGYADPRYWTEPFHDGDEVIPFEDGVIRLVDQSGLPGPSTWIGGDYPDGEADHPVGGVSWYEALAYANYVGKRLPSIYHWNRAAGTAASALIAPASNILGTASRPVGETRVVSRAGARDMAGNVREWCWNASGENRFIMGGGWSDAPYMFADAYSQPAWDRSEINGIRLASYEDSDILSLALRDIPRPTRDFYSEAPISDERFAAYRSLFAYDRGPLNVAVESSDSTHEDFVRQHVSFEAAYDGPRMEAVLFLPRGVEPPYQTVVYFPGSGALFEGGTDAVQNRSLDFVVKNGRAVVVPIYRGTYGRGGGELLDTDQPSESVAYRDVVIQWVRDLGRTIDYLETRPDVAADNLGFYGISWGARMGVLMLAVEERFQAAVLYVGGLKHQRALPEADPASYVRRVTVPVLMLNGRYDHFFPLESSQIPLYELLGTPEQDKEHLVFDGGHDVPGPIRIRESLAWLDRYLGPVR